MIGQYGEPNDGLKTELKMAQHTETLKKNVAETRRRKLIALGATPDELEKTIGIMVDVDVGGFPGGHVRGYSVLDAVALVEDDAAHFLTGTDGKPHPHHEPPAFVKKYFATDDEEATRLVEQENAGPVVAAAPKRR